MLRYIAWTVALLLMALLLEAGFPKLGGLIFFASTVVEFCISVVARNRRDGRDD